MSKSPFDDLTDIYEAMIDWPKRLAAEEAYLRPLFEQAGVRRVADVACGTGRHAAMFHGWGMEVVGLDISPSMIDRAQAAFGNPPGLQWRVQAFDRPAGEAGSFDAAVCLGNSLALAPDVSAAQHALRNMLTIVRPGGAVVVQVLNLWKLPDGPSVWQKVLRRPIAGQDVTIAKGVHRSGNTGWVEMIIIPQAEDQPHHARSVPFLGLTRDILESVATDVGARSRFYGSVKQDPYDPAASTDLIMIAQR